MNPCVSTYNSLMNVLAKSGDLEWTKSLYDEMLVSRMPLNTATYNALVFACSVRSAMKGARFWMDQMQKNGLQANHLTFETVIGGYQVQGKCLEAERVFRELTLAKLQPRATTMSRILQACRTDVERAGLWLRRHTAAGVQPTHDALACMVKSCLRSDDRTRAATYFELFREAKMTPSSSVYQSLVDAWAETGHLETCITLVDSMKNAQLKPDASMFQALVKACVRKPDGPAAAEWLERALVAGVTPTNDTIAIAISSFAELPRETGQLKLDDVFSRVRQSSCSGAVQKLCQTLFARAVTSGVRIPQEVIDMAHGVGSEAVNPAKK